MSQILVLVVIKMSKSSALEPMVSLAQIGLQWCSLGCQHPGQKRDCASDLWLKCLGKQKTSSRHIPHITIIDSKKLLTVLVLLCEWYMSGYFMIYYYLVVFFFRLKFCPLKNLAPMATAPCPPFYATDLRAKAFHLYSLFLQWSGTQTTIMENYLWKWGSQQLQICTSPTDYITLIFPCLLLLAN